MKKALKVDRIFLFRFFFFLRPILAVLIFRNRSRFNVQGSGLGKRLKLDSRNARKNTGFDTSFPSTVLQICWDVEAVDFPVQNACKMAYGDESTTFEPVNAYDFS